MIAAFCLSRRLQCIERGPGIAARKVCQQIEGGAENADALGAAKLDAGDEIGGHAR